MSSAGNPCGDDTSATSVNKRSADTSSEKDENKKVKLSNGDGIENANGDAKANDANQTEDNDATVAAAAAAEEAAVALAAISDDAAMPVSGAAALDREDSSASIVVISEDEEAADDDMRNETSNNAIDDVDDDDDDEDDDDDDDDDEDCRIVGITSSSSTVERLEQHGISQQQLLASLIQGNLPEQLRQDPELLSLIVQFGCEPVRRSRLENICKLEHAIQLLTNCNRILVLTGAGVSVSCGIPDFRSRDGIYAKLAKEYTQLPDPQSMFDIRYFRSDQRPFFKFAKEIYPSKYTPSVSHRFIKCLEKRGKLLRNYSQNIDTLERIAGIKRVLNCHGSFSTASCMRCKHRVELEFIKDDIMNERIPMCPKCMQVQQHSAVGEAGNTAGEPAGKVSDEAGEACGDAGKADNAADEADNPKVITRDETGESVGKAGDAAGKAGDAAGKAGDAAGKADDAAGKTDDAAGKADDSAGKAGISAGKTDEAAVHADEDAATEAVSNEGNADQIKPGDHDGKSSSSAAAEAAAAAAAEAESSSRRSSISISSDSSSGSGFHSAAAAAAAAEADTQPVLKPDIVFFGESLPREFYHCINQDEAQADLLIVMGSSLKVQPVSLIPRSLPGTVPQILINREPLCQHNFDISLLGDCDRIVMELCRRLGWSEVGDENAEGSIMREISEEELLAERAAAINSSTSGSATEADEAAGMAQYLPPGTFAHCEPNLYIFPGAEVPTDYVLSVSGDDDHDDDFDDDAEDVDDNCPVMGSEVGDADFVNLVSSDEEGEASDRASSNAVPSRKDVTSVDDSCNTASSAQSLIKDASTVEPFSIDLSSVKPSSKDLSTLEPSSKDLSSVEPSSKDLSTAESSSKDLSTAEPSSKDLSTVEPSSKDLSTVEPSSKDLSTVEPSSKDLSTVEPSSKDLSTVEPSSKDLSTAEPSSKDLSTVEPSSKDFSSAEPSCKKSIIESGSKVNSDRGSIEQSDNDASTEEAIIASNDNVEQSHQYQQQHHHQQEDDEHLDEELLGNAELCCADQHAAIDEEEEEALLNSDVE